MIDEATQAASAQKKSFSMLVMVDKTFKYWALAPAVIILILLTVFPTLQMLRMSVSQIDLVPGGVSWTFTGLTNFRTFLDDAIFRIALKNTVVFVVAAVSIEMVLGFALALLASRIPNWSGIYRTILVLPLLIPPVAIGGIWRQMYSFDFGIFNQILIALGLPPQTWNASPTMAFPSVILVDVWHWTPFVFLIALAGLEAMPVEVLEAARVDGANRWQMLRAIIIPLVWPALSVVLMFRTIFAFKVFDEVFLLTEGGPGTATEVVSLYIYKIFFPQNRLGYGALLSVLTILVICLFIFAYQRTQWRKE